MTQGLAYRITAWLCDLWGVRCCYHEAERAEEAATQAEAA